MKPLFTWLILCLLATRPVAAADKPMEFTDATGQVRAPLAPDGKKATVLIFISRDCPIANAFVPEMNRLADDYAKDFAFYLVHGDPDVTAADAKKHAEVFEIKATVLLDPAQRLAKLFKAKVTPEAFVIGRDGATLYQGRINDLYAALTKRRPQPTTRDLRDALDAVIAGKPVTNPLTKAVGCSIPEPR